MRVLDLEVVSDVTVGEGGFLSVRRLRVRNLRHDGTKSAEYGYEFVVRPKGLDAVVVCAWHRATDGRVRVLLRDQIRPAVYFGRPDRRLFVRECVAGIVEPGDLGEKGLRRRAALELEEEAGFRIAPEALVPLGSGSFPSPGAMSERIWFFAAEVDPNAGSAPLGDGSPAEEGATLHWMPIEDAISACVDGELVDLKTETALRRLYSR